MAATDIQYGGLDPVIYTPDFSFLRYVLDKKTGQYEQGLKEASSAYNSIKKELSDPVNAAKRDEYLKNAQGQLQKIASSDLSLNQNVAFANTVFEPIATDKAFIYDSYYTANNKKELSKMDAWAKSADEDERRKFNPEIQAWLKRDLDSIKNGKGDANNYKVEGRSAFAYINPQDVLDKAVNDKGFTYKVDDLGSPYIVTTKGGVGGKENYNTFAQEVLASDLLYQQQLGILGTSRKEGVLDMYKNDPKYAAFANATPEQIYADYAKTSFNQHKEESKAFLDTKTKVLNTDMAANAAYENANAEKLAKGANDAASGQDTPEARMYNEHLAKIKGVNDLSDYLKGAQKGYDEMYGGTGDDKLNNYISTFSKNPTAFFSDQQFKNDVTRFSNIKASSLERSIKEDRAVVDVMVAKTNALKVANDIKDDIVDNATDQQKIAIKEAELALKGLKTVKNADGTTSVVSKEADVVPIDIEGTQITIINSLNKVKSAIERNSSMAVNNMVNGLGILESMGLSSDEVGKLRSYYRRGWDNTTGKPTSANAEEQKILSKAYTQLYQFAKNNNQTAFLDSERAKIAGGKKSIDVKDLPDLLDKAISGFKSRNEEDAAAKTSIAEYKNNVEAMNLASTALTVGKDAVIKAHEKDPSYAGMFIQRNGSTDIINESDVLKNIPKVDSQNNPIDDNTRKQIANEYIAGSLTVKIGKAGSSRDGGGYGYTAVKLSNGRTISLSGSERFSPFNGDYNSVKIPLPDKYKELTKKINSQAMPPGFEDMVGKVAGSPFYKLNGETKQQVIDTLGHITPTNSTIMVYAEGTSSSTQVTDNATLELVRNAIADKTAVSEVALMTSSPTNNGGQAVEVKFAVDLKKGDGSKNPLAGRSFFFPITPTEASRPIFKVFDKVNEVSEFDPKRKKGETYKIETFAAEGIRAEIRPKEPGSNEGTVVIYRKKYNPTTNSYSDAFEPMDKVPYDLGKTTFAELKSNIYTTAIYPYVTGTINYQKQTAATTAANGGGYTATSVLSHFNNLKHTQQ